MKHAAHALTRIEKMLVSPNLVQFGNTYKHNMQPLADSFAGEPAFLAGIRIKGNVDVSVNAAVNGFQNYGYILQRAIKNIRLVVAGHEHYVNCDGEDASIHDALMSGASRVADLTLPALATGNMTLPVDVFLRFDNPRALNERRWDDTIACALFQDPQKNYLQFDIGTTLDTGAQLNVRATGFASGLEIHAYVVMRDDAYAHVPWTLRTFTDTQLEHVIQPKGSVHYLLLAARALNALQRVDHSLVDTQHVKLGGELLHAQLSFADYVDRVRFDRPAVFEGLSNAGWKSDTATSTHGWSALPLFLPPADMRKTKLSRGDMAVRYGQMPVAFTDAKFRYLMRETGVASNDFAQDVAVRLGVDEETARTGAIFTLAATAGRGGPAAGVLPMKIRAPTRFMRATERFGRKGR